MPKRPPKRLQKLFKPVIDRCTSLIVNAIPQTPGAGDAIITIKIAWPAVDGKPQGVPEGWPGRNKIVKLLDGKIVIAYNVVLVLKWFKANGYIDYDAATLFRQRLPLMMVLAKMDLKLENMLNVEKLFDLGEKEL